MALNNNKNEYNSMLKKKYYTIFEKTKQKNLQHKMLKTVIQKYSELYLPNCYEIPITV